MIAGMHHTLYKLVQRKKIDLIHAHNIYPDGVAAAWFGKRFKVPVILSARGSDINDLMINNSLRFRQTVWALKNSSNITAVSRPLCSKLVELGAETSRVHFIPNGVDNKKFYFQEKNLCRRKLELKSINKILLFVGKLRLVKGLHYLIEALSILKQQNKMDFNTIIIGGGYLEEELKMAVRGRQLQQQVFFKGNLPPHEINDWMGASDLFCLPSLNEGLPNVILEALSCGVPVVATSVGGIPDLINSSNGILAEAADERSLADALISGFERKWDYREISRTVSHLNWENCANSYFEIIESSIKINRWQNAK
jgi:glycosyltransferase involved in cell wall biosynthesis